MTTRDAAALYAVLVAASPDGIVAIDDESRILAVNPALERMFGYAAKDLLGAPLTRLMPERMRRHHEGGIDRYMTTGERRVDWRGTRLVGERADGTEIPIKVSFGEADMGGRRTFLGFIRDLSAEVAADLALREARHLHEIILASVGEGIIGQNGAGEIVFVNATAETILGTSGANLVGRKLHDALRHSRADGRALPAAECALARALRAGHSVHLHDDCFWRPDGTPVSVDVVATPMGEGDGALGAVIAFRDTTARRALEEQLRQTQKMEAVGQLAGGIAHDFNNLLTVILSHAQFLLDDHGIATEQAEDTSAIHLAATRAAALTRQLLAFSRRQVLLPAALHLTEVVARLAPMLQRLIGEHITFATHAWTSNDLVFADRGQLEQVITNLVLNARDAMPHGGGLMVEVRESVSDEYVVLRVVDTGVGMSDLVRHRAFEPFFTTKPTGEGTGLGLSTAFGIVAQTGGQIEIESAVGVGTTVTVTLPRAAGVPDSEVSDVASERASPGDHARHPSPAEHPSVFILLAEDEEAVRRVTARILRGAGYEVLEARHGADALLVASGHEGPIDLLLTDVVMPEVNGIELAVWYRGRYPGGSVIFLSGYTNDDLFRKGLTEEQVRFVHKPFTSALILAAVAEALNSGPP